MELIPLMRQLRTALTDLTADVSDEKAARYPSLFSPWRKDTLCREGERRQHGGILYKCRQTHTSQEGFPPHLVPALWAPIDTTHSGTPDDPIPALRGMEYTYGLCYLDREDGRIYRCTRSGEAAGGTVVLHYLPHELTGQYFAEVTP